MLVNILFKHDMFTHVSVVSKQEGKKKREENEEYESSRDSLKSTRPFTLSLIKSAYTHNLFQSIGEDRLMALALSFISQFDLLSIIMRGKRSLTAFFRKCASS